jgi:hypothetical protein
MKEMFLEICRSTPIFVAITAFCLIAQSHHVAPDMVSIYDVRDVIVDNASETNDIPEARFRGYVKQLMAWGDMDCRRARQISKAELRVIEGFLKYGNSKNGVNEHATMRRMLEASCWPKITEAGADTMIYVLQNAVVLKAKGVNPANLLNTLLANEDFNGIQRDLIRTILTNLDGSTTFDVNRAVDEIAYYHEAPMTIEKARFIESVFIQYRHSNNEGSFQLFKNELYSDGPSTLEIQSISNQTQSR